MEKLIVAIFISLFIIDCLTGILTAIIYNPKWKEYFKEVNETEDSEHWMKDSFFVNETIPLGLKAEEALSQRKTCEELYQLENRVLSDEKSFVWLWDYANKYELKNLQKELVRISKLNGETPIYAVS